MYTNMYFVLLSVCVHTRTSRINTNAFFSMLTFRCGGVAPRFANSVSAPPAAAAVPPRKVNWPVICWPPWSGGACRGICCFACLRMNWGNWWCGRGSPGYVASVVVIHVGGTRCVTSSTGHMRTCSDHVDCGMYTRIFIC
jgi:hypothetical protein